MKIYRIVKVGFLSASVVFFSGYVLAEESPGPLIKGQRSVIDVKTRNNSALVKTGHRKVTAKHRWITAKQANLTYEDELAKPSEPQKPLDLSIPYTDVDKSDRITELDTETSIQTANIFAGENKKKTRPVQIDGKLLMSPEPEIEKQKSADGAGIVINLKP